ncbi:nicotinate phosphoribosyltransferase [Limibacter armeniacum]|uniref:nicotinate phosphoribosyltransferase n=1 Tax=Limibacter armeniacum TaxID=466084 RepID=UPI002FE6B2CF
MNITKDLYGTSLSLLTDLYQFTMAYGYWKTGHLNKEGVFHAYFRKHPFKGGFTVACGLDYLIDFLQNLKFSADEVAYLASLNGSDGKPLFEEGFIDYLRDFKFSCDIEAVAEGTVVFPNEPLVRVKGPILECMLIETPILNIINFQSLIATKAARLRLSAKDDQLLEFGLRRAQGIDGSLAASRASYIGGCDATSNVLAGKLFGIPVKGTHAHSWVMSFDSELSAFETYAEAMPNNCVFLVDTYDTIQGVAHAIEVGKKLKAQGHELNGIRLDSGDLAYLSIQAREMLDHAGFESTAIVASNDLDEYLIANLKNEQNAQINIWGVGTKLAASFDQPALGGVYKIGAVKENKDSHWKYKIKLSEQLIKVSNPGIQQVRRYYYPDGQCMADMIFDEIEELPTKIKVIDPSDSFRNKRIPDYTEYEDLLQPIFKKGDLVYKRPEIKEIKERVAQQMSLFHSGIKRFSNPHIYPVGLEESLYDKKSALILMHKNEE